MHEALQGAGGKFVQSAVGDMLMQTGMMKGAVLCSEVLMTLFTGEKKEEDSPLVQGENEQEKYPIQQYLEIGLGVLRFSPKVFWDLSITEFMSALNGHHLKNGKNKTNNPLLKRNGRFNEEISQTKNYGIKFSNNTSRTYS